MLRTASHLKGTSIAATDGEIGSVQDLYFDDHSWTIRYLVVDTGTWLPGRQVLISPRSIMAVTDEAKIPVSLTKSQVENSPSTDVDKPVELVITQGARVLWRERHRRLVPNLPIHVSAQWLAVVTRTSCAPRSPIEKAAAPACR